MSTCSSRYQRANSKSFSATTFASDRHSCRNRSIGFAKALGHDSTSVFKVHSIGNYKASLSSRDSSRDHHSNRSSTFFCGHAVSGNSSGFHSHSKSTDEVCSVDNYDVTRFSLDSSGMDFTRSGCSRSMRATTEYQRNNFSTARSYLTRCKVFS